MKHVSILLAGNLFAACLLVGCGPYKSHPEHAGAALATSASATMVASARVPEPTEVMLRIDPSAGTTQTPGGAYVGSGDGCHGTEPVSRISMVGGAS